MWPTAVKCPASNAGALPLLLGGEHRVGASAVRANPEYREVIRVHHETKPALGPASHGGDEILGGFK
jgi:hypothetical protein